MWMLEKIVGWITCGLEIIDLVYYRRGKEKNQ